MEAERLKGICNKQLNQRARGVSEVICARTLHLLCEAHTNHTPFIRTHTLQLNCQYYNSSAYSERIGFC